MTQPAPANPVTPPAERTALLQELERLLPALQAADPADPRRAETALEGACPRGSLRASRIEALARVGVRDGWLLPRSAGPRVRFGRLAKDLGGYTVDFVLMEGPAAGHTHPNGEINLGFRWSGDPRFDGRPTGWVVFPPGSHHVPTVTGGEMLLVYFLPGGQVVWDRAT
jgi:hypothetical protein